MLKDKACDVDTSSSEDEAYSDALKEAADHEFLQESLFSTKEPHNKPNIENIRQSKQHKKSNIIRSQRLREVKDEFENFGVTPGFQDFVAKKLDDILEKTICLKEKKSEEGVEVNVSQQENTDGQKKSYGIKLLTSSSNFLSVDNCEEENNFKPIRKRKQSIEISNVHIARCKEVAVDPEHILLQTDTKAWTDKRKGVEFKYVQSEKGILIEQS